VAAIIHGIILAFGLILPLGVQNVFVFNQGAVQPRFSRVLPAIITASVCDTILITLAVLGVSAIVFGVYWIKVTLLTVGVVFLLYMCCVTWKGESSIHDSSNAVAMTSRTQIAFAASVSLLNPHAIMDTVGVIGTSSLSYSGIDKVSFTLACIIVSWVWFFSLAFVGRQVRKIDQSGGFISILNKVSALIMWGTAMYLGFSLIL